MGLGLHPGGTPRETPSVDQQGRRPLMTGDQAGQLVGLVIACALAAGVVLCGIALLRALALHPQLIGPSTEQDEQVEEHPVGPGEFPPDLAWPFYPFRQSRADLEQARGDVTELNRTIWRRPANSFRSSVGWWIVFPIPLAVIGFLLIMSLASWFCYLVYALVDILCAGVSLAVLVPAATIMQAAERWRRGRKNAQAACMMCFHVTQWPAFRCRT